MKTWTAAFAAAWMVVPTSSAFQTAPISSQRKASQLYSDPQAFTEYMVKAHEDKLKAVKQVEEKKNVEIEVRVADELLWHMSVRRRHPTHIQLNGY